MPSVKLMNDYATLVERESQRKISKCSEERSVAVTLSPPRGPNPGLRRERSRNNALRHDKSCRILTQLK
jgi:hypothetical protein